MTEPFILKIEGGSLIYSIRNDCWNLHDSNCVLVGSINANQYATIREFKVWGCETLAAMKRYEG
jgi:hypothetical protein